MRKLVELRGITLNAASISAAMDVGQLGSARLGSSQALTDDVTAVC